MRQNYLYLLISLLFLINCNGQTKPIGKEPVDLENFDFNTKISDLFPNEYKSKEYKNYYEIPGSIHSQIVEKDTTFTNEYSENKKPIGIEYRQQSSTSIDKLAIFENQIFNKVNIATTLDNKIKVINGVADEVTRKQSEDFIKNISKKYGKPKIFKSQGNENFTCHEWKTNNRIIRFVTTFDDESGTLKLNVDEKMQAISAGKKEPHFTNYLFVINQSFKNEVFGKLKTGDFVYLD